MYLLLCVYRTHRCHLEGYYYIACNEYWYKDNIALGSVLLEGWYSSVKLTMDKGYPLLASVLVENNSPYLFIRW